MMQSRFSSFIESLVNIVIGYMVALLSQLVIFPWFGIDVPLSTNLWIGAWFTLISLARSYVIRRWFNARIHSAAMALAGDADQDYSEMLPIRRCHRDKADLYIRGEPYEFCHRDCAETWI